MPDAKIITAIASDTLYIADLMRKNYEALSFVPSSSITRNAAAGNILLAKVNNADAGYLYHAPLQANVRIHQACIQYDARGCEYGAAMVSKLITKCRQNGTLQISLRCADDLQANLFWQSMGFKFCGSIPGGARRRRRLNGWLLPLTPAIITV